jgi:hypothetical protein
VALAPFGSSVFEEAMGVAIRASVRPSQFWVGLGAMLAASCLLTTSLEGLEGPPLPPDGGINEGGLPTDSGTADIADATIADSDGGFGNVDIGSDSRGPIEDAPHLDGDGDTKGPLVVTSTSGTPRGIAEYGLEIYWVQTDFRPGIAHVPKLGGMSGFIDTASNAFDVAVDAEYVYWSTGTDGKIYRKPILADGSSGAFYFPGASGAFYLAADGAGGVFLTGLNSVAVGPRLDGGSSDALYIDQPGAAGIAIHGTEVFWSVHTGIVGGSVKGQGETPATALYDGAPGEMAGIATDGKEIYWIGAEGNVRALSLEDPSAMVREVCRASAEMGDAESDVRPARDGGTWAGADIAVDEGWVYFTEPALRRISKCRKR